MEDQTQSNLWVRIIADDAFRQAVIDDPLGAVALFENVTATADQVRELDEMTRDDRETVITAVVREAFVRGAASRYGLEIPPDPGDADYGPSS